ncbi:MAG: hypothetical protein NTU53_10655 [Planctomycetota bacterium]|nr:hypothetical protein [Planctomycetota bacterium]
MNGKIGSIRWARIWGNGNRTILGLLAIHAILLTWQAYGDSATWDEIGHVAAGLEHWRSGRFRLYPVNPPLVRLVATAPVAFWLPAIKPDLDAMYGQPGARSEFAVGAEVARGAGSSYFVLLALARCMCIPFSLLGAWICYHWAQELWGQWAARTALILWVFSPSVLAYGHLMSPDMGAAGLGVAAAYLWRRWLLHPTLHRAALAGMGLGLAELSKTTWLILLVLWPALWIGWRLLSPMRPIARQWLREGAQVVAVMLLALWVLNLGYVFEGSCKPLAEYRFVSRALGGPRSAETARAGWGNRFTGSWYDRLPIPLPENYLLGIDLQKRDFECKMMSYLRGEWRLGGWWYYYLYAMLVKEPLGTWLLLLLAIGGVIACSRCYAAPLREELLLVVPLAVVLTLVSSQTGLNHHLRYVLPGFPFIFILISRVGCAVNVGHRAVVIVGCLLLGYSCLSSLSVVPHSLSYFNELVGGPRNGHFQLGNSNADWGQDLLYLKSWYDQHPEARPFHVSYDLPLIDPELAGIEYENPPIGPKAADTTMATPEQFGPRPGWYAISVNHLHRLDHKFDYFLEFQPMARVGYSMGIYHISLDDANRVRRKLNLPELAGDPPGLHAGLGSRS